MTDYEQARKAMVDCQVRPSDVTEYAIIEAMLAVPRELFVPRSKAEVAYADCDISLDEGRVLMPARTFSKMLEAADIGADDLVLDVAPATGYSTAVLSRLAGAVVAAEPSEAMAERLQGNVSDLELDNVLVAAPSDPVGDPENGPYDVIFVNSGVEDLPHGLLDQLKDGGRLVAIFMSGAVGQCRVRIKTGDKLSDRYVFNATASVHEAFVRKEEFAL